MQVTETLAEGLKREYQIKVSAADLEARVVARLDEMKDRVQLRGFRPGKVPVNHLRKLYGRSVMAETIETVIRESNAKLVDERGYKLAMEPKVTLPEEQAEVEKVLGVKYDLDYKLAFEVLPKIELGDFKGLSLERLTTEVTDAEIDEAVGKIADQNRPYSLKPEGAKLESGDRAIVSFTGKIGGTPFEGGTGTEHRSRHRLGLVHSRLRGSARGHEARRAAPQIEVTFPAEYSAARSRPARLQRSP